MTSDLWGAKGAWYHIPVWHDMSMKQCEWKPAFMKKNVLLLKCWNFYQHRQHIIVIISNCAHCHSMRSLLYFYSFCLQILWGDFIYLFFQQTCFVLAASYYSYDCTYLHLETATDISPLVAEMLHWDICQFNCLLKAMGSADVSGADRAFLVP